MGNKGLNAAQPNEGGDEVQEETIVLATVPVESGERLLREKFYERFANQADQLDKLGQQMITIELAIPALYAAILKLLEGENAVLVGDFLIGITFGCWFLSLLLTFASLFPRKYRVDPTIIKGDPTGMSNVMGLEEFFYKSAGYKRRLLIMAGLFFWGGIVASLFLLFGQSSGPVP
jgi:hypothetical protein